MGQNTDDGVLRTITRIRPHLQRSIAIINGKGGQGKTTCVAQLSGLMAEALQAQGSEKRVLAIDMDPQGNLGLDLGYAGSDDAGASIVQAMMGVGSLNPIRDVRPQLDVVPGGKKLFDIPGIMFGRTSNGGRDEARLALAAALADIAAPYDWVLIDCPPLEAVLQDLALVAARWAVIPVSFDEGSRQGMSGVSARFASAIEINPELDLLGVVMFGLAYRPARKDGSEAGQRARVRAQLTEDLRTVGADAPVFSTVIRRLDSVAESCRKRGQLVHELERADGPKWWQIRAGTATGTVLPTTEAAKLAAEYEELAGELFGRALDLEGEPGA